MRQLLLPVLQGPGERQNHLADVGGLLKVVPGPLANGQFGTVRITGPGDDDDLRRFPQGPQHGDRLQADAVRQPNIEQYYIEIPLRRPLQTLSQGKGIGSLITLAHHQIGEHLARQIIVIDD